MISLSNADAANVRVWVVAAEPWQPDSLFDEPRAATALFPALERCLTRGEAEQFVAGFNEQMLTVGGRRWVVARSVTPSLAGDLVAGQRLGGGRAEEHCQENGGIVRPPRVRLAARASRGN